MQRKWGLFAIYILSIPPASMMFAICDEHRRDIVTSKWSCFLCRLTCITSRAIVTTTVVRGFHHNSTEVHPADSLYRMTKDHRANWRHKGGLRPHFLRELERPKVQARDRSTERGPPAFQLATGVRACKGVCMFSNTQFQSRHTSAPWSPTGLSKLVIPKNHLCLLFRYRQSVFL